MRFDTATPEREAFARTFDVCVIGSGPAGITLARRLAARGLDVALMEGGDLYWSQESQDLYVGENTGLPYHDLDMARLRYFGGTSGHWNGACPDLDAASFRPNPLNGAGDGWPIAKADLDPYAAEAAGILDLGAPVPEVLDLPEPIDGLQEARWRRSAPTRFGEKYLDEITASDRIWLGLNANLVDLRLDSGLNRVTQAVFRSFAPEDPGFIVEAPFFALCTGGIENARLLLNFDSQMPGGIGNAHDQVGRHFCDHPGVFLGEVLFEGPTPGLPDDAFFVTLPEFRAENAILGMNMRFHLREQRTMSFFTEAARSLACNLPFALEVAQMLGQKQPRCDLGGLADWRRSLTPEQHPWARLTTNSEQALNPDSRVTLGAERDPLGLRRARLHWELMPIDYRTLKVTTLAMGQALAETGIGRLRVYDWLLAEDPVLPTPDDKLGEIGAYHHMCTTRMSADPALGVVDADCRVHGVSNLFVGGSSVFATSSFVNPTYPIVQLALRLGDHVADQVALTGIAVAPHAPVSR
jgi:choline dehydrogenase-like flavoprotein